MEEIFCIEVERGQGDLGLCLSLEISISNLTFLKICPSESFIYKKYRALKNFFKLKNFGFWLRKEACSVLMAENMKL